MNHIRRFNESDESSLFYRYWDKNPSVYLSVDENGDEQMSDEKPFRQQINKGYWYSNTIRKCPKGFIKKLTGLSISWDDEPIRYLIDAKKTIRDEDFRKLKLQARDIRTSGAADKAVIRSYEDYIRIINDCKDSKDNHIKVLNVLDDANKDFRDGKLSIKEIDRIMKCGEDILDSFSK